MEIQTLPPKHSKMDDYRSNVDTSSPFRSVKEAVAVFGERFLTPETYAPKVSSVPKQENFNTSWGTSSVSFPSRKDDGREESRRNLEVTMKRLEWELEETKTELKLLKERESETEVALASLNAELHLNMSKMAQAEAAAAAKAADRGSSLVFGGRESGEKEKENSMMMMMMRKEKLPSLAQILSQKEAGSGKKMMKKKPIVPLLGDLFSKKKTTTSTNKNVHNPIYSSSFVQYWN